MYTAKPSPMIKAPKVPSVVVYSFGKIGSKAIVSALNCDAANIHNLYYSNWPCYPNYRGAEASLISRAIMLAKFPVRRALLRSHRPLIITGVRDPLERNMSMFFHHLAAYVFSYTTGFPYGKASANRTSAETDPEYLATVFDARFDHAYPINWFDIEFKRYTGIDIYNEPLLANGASCGVIYGDRFNVFAYRYEAMQNDIGLIAESLSEVLDSEITIGTSNRGIDKWYSGLYSEFKECFVPSHELSRLLYDSKYSQFFGYRPQPSVS